MRNKILALLLCFITFLYMPTVLKILNFIRKQLVLQGRFFYSFCNLWARGNHFGIAKTQSGAAGICLTI